VDSYLEWSAQVGQHGLHVDLPEPSVERVQGFRHIEVMDAFRMFLFFFVLYTMYLLLTKERIKSLCPC
jgi:hypothetical protein